MSAKKDLTGLRFNRWLVICEASEDNPNGPRWESMCDCGSVAIVQGRHLRSGKSRSCGCLQREEAAARHLTHGQVRTRAWVSWCQMRQRCTNPKSTKWHRYGGRGISVCERWMTFENFHADMGDPPKGTSIDRINNDGNYEPGNCQWSPPYIQARNTSRNILVDYDGRSQTISEWSRETGVDDGTLSYRLRKGILPPELFAATRVGERDAYGRFQQ